MRRCKGSYPTDDGPVTCAIQQGHRGDHRSHVGRFYDNKGWGRMLWERGTSWWAVPRFVTARVREASDR